jgi:hypothetical protein
MHLQIFMNYSVQGGEGEDGAGGERQERAGQPPPGRAAHHHTLHHPGQSFIQVSYERNQFTIKLLREKFSRAESAMGGGGEGAKSFVFKSNIEILKSLLHLSSGGRGGGGGEGWLP